MLRLLVLCVAFGAPPDAVSQPPATKPAVTKVIATKPAAPDTGNGGEKRWEYTNEKIGALENQILDLRNEVASLREALQTVMKILESR